MSNVTTTQLASEVSTELGINNPGACRLILDQAVDAIKKHLTDGRNIKLTTLGSIKPIVRKGGKKVRNFTTGETKIQEDYLDIKIDISQQFKGDLNNGN